MRVPFSLWSFGPILVIAGTLGCAGNGGDGASPAAPSTVRGASASLSQPGDVTPLAGPGAGYNASGWWHAEIYARAQGTLIDEDDYLLSQDAAGNITFADDVAQFTLTRRGPGQGRVIPYELSAYGPIQLPNSPCEMRLSGVATLDTATDTITVQHVTGIDDDCDEVKGVYVTLERN